MVKNINGFFSKYIFRQPKKYKYKTSLKKDALVIELQTTKKSYLKRN
jgi:hypothetical protein